MTTLDTRTLVDRIADTLRAQVVEGQLEPGKRVRQEEIAAQLGVSRTPLREAFRQLEAEGWFQKHARQGLFVSELDWQEMFEISSARLVLEPISARVAAATHDAASERRLREILERSEALSGTSDSAEFAQLNREFHFELYGLGDGAPLTELSRSTVHFWNRFSRYHRFYWRDVEHLSRSTKAHQLIAEMWFNRDGEATERAVAEHILEAVVARVHDFHPEAKPGAALIEICRRYNLQDMF